MSSYSLSLTEWPSIHLYILQLEQEGLVTRTFRRLDPQRQHAIVVAILDEAAERGPSAVNIKNVAKRAGVSVGSLYQYFKDRDNMLAFAVDLCVRYTQDLFNQYRPYMAELPLRQALSVYLKEGIEWSQGEEGFLQLFARAAYQGEATLIDRLVRPIATTLREMVRDMLSAAVVRGEIRSDIDLEATSRIVHALTIAVGDSQLLPYLNNYFQVVDPSLETERTHQAFLDLVLNGVGAPASRTTQA